MASIKPLEETSKDFTAISHHCVTMSQIELIAVRSYSHTFSRDDKPLSLTRSIMRGKDFRYGNKAQHPVAGASTTLETTIELKPMVAALIAMVAGSSWDC